METDNIPQVPAWFTLLLVAFSFIVVLVVGLDSYRSGWNAGFAEGVQQGVTHGHEISAERCNKTFDYLQQQGVLTNVGNGHKIAWDYVQVLLCDQPGAGEQ